LCASERKPQALIARQKRTGRQCVQQIDQRVVAQRFACNRAVIDRGRFAFRPQGQRAGHIAAERFQESKIVSFRDAERARDRVTLRLFRQ
jgi:hypothetical protein